LWVEKISPFPAEKFCYTTVSFFEGDVDLKNPAEEAIRKDEVYSRGDSAGDSFEI